MFFNIRRYEETVFQQLGVWRGSSYSVNCKTSTFLSKLLKKALGRKIKKAVGRALDLIFVLI